MEQENNKVNPLCNISLPANNSKCDDAPNLEPIELRGFGDPKSKQLKGIHVNELDPKLVYDMKMHGILPIDDHYYTDGKGGYFGVPSPARLALEEAIKLLK
jgi:hypothetical protein